MKLYTFLVYSLSISGAVARHALQQRQESPSTAAITATLTPSSTFVPSAAGSSTASPSQSARAAADSATASSPSNTTSKGSSSTTTGLTLGQTNNANDTTRGDPKPLPISPKITPAIGLAGAILMISGLAYGLIGIKNKWLYSFFGVAYLVSLAVTVLIIYCMNPPVSDAVQGAFLVATIFAGALAGGAALIFRDLADGFGCLLGGFCLSMWFLSLKEGGLIRSQAGKAIFIGCMSAAVFGLSLTQRTRTWGLVVSIPFSGATATILGIDCFSRAGLKEFWIYIWDINSDEFPLNTKTYPITRGIRVEVAGIILLFVLGLASQLKLSKIVKQRRDQKEASRMRREQDLEREETEAGKRVEKTIEREMVRWESVYGGKPISTAASTDSMTKNSASVKEKRVSTLDEMEMSEMSSPRTRPVSKGPISTTVTVTAAEDNDDEIQRIDLQGNRLSAITKAASTASRRSAVVSQRTSTELRPNAAPSVDDESARSSLVPPPPDVVPLPFKIPGIEVDGPRSVQGSLSAIEESLLDRRLSSKRGSGASATWKRLSFGKTLTEVTGSEEDLVFAAHEEDQASSIAATLDELDEDEMSLSAVTLPRSPLDESFGNALSRLSQRSSMDPVSPVDDDNSLDGERTVNSKKSSDHLEVGPRVTKRNSLTFGETPELRLFVDESQDNLKRSSIAISTSSSRRVSAVLEEKIQVAKNMEQTPTIMIPSDDNADAKSDDKDENGAVTNGKINEALLKGESTQTNNLEGRKDQWKSWKSSASAGLSEASQTPTLGSLMEHLPNQVSKVVLQYRTNEWAKHLAVAEAPEPDEIEDPPSPGVKVDTSFKDTSSQNHTPVSPIVDPDRFITPVLPSVKRSSTGSAMQERPKTASAAQTARSTSPSVSRTPSGAYSQLNTSTSMLGRNNSSNSVRPTTGYRSPRNVSTPLLGQTLTESPAESPVDDKRIGTLKKVGSGPVLPEKTLLGKRDSLMKGKPKTMSFAQSTPNLAAGLQTDDDLEDIPLSRRKSFLKSPSRQNSQRQDSWPPQSAFVNDLSNFDSHQPKRNSSAISQEKREDMLTNWRESLRQERNQVPLASQRIPNADEMRRAKMLDEKRQKQYREQQQQMMKDSRDDAFDHMMRSGNMIDAHKHAMRKMQENAKTG